MSGQPVAKQDSSELLVKTGGGETLSPPRHIAIIMDGNGRWASRRGLPRFEGHRRGVESVRRTVKSCIELGVSYLTIYSFSTENWSRPAAEVAELMGLLRRFIRNDLADLHKQNVRVKIIGSRAELTDDLRLLLADAETVTAGNTGLTLVVAFNYGGRQEVVAALRTISGKVASGQISSDDINEEMLSCAMMTDGIPDPDLLIRTSGEQRISNFLLWQMAYTEFVFLPVLWPDFDKASLVEAIAQYHGRERRFGGVDSVT
ncbi:MAG: isoprenyl transferase [Beijerinckiaceae bacterium]